jgi:HlyD family secretion protein
MSGDLLSLSRARHYVVEVCLTMHNSFRNRWRAFTSRIDILFDHRELNQDGELVQLFSPDAIAIAEAPVPLPAHAALYVVLVLLILAIFWSVLGTIDRIVVAPGKIATQTPLIVMQPFSTSRITKILVRPGNSVRKGQVLATFDPAFAQADAATLVQKVSTLAPQIERLQAQLNGARFFTPRTNAGPEGQTQAQIFSQEMAEYSAQIAVRDSRIREIHSQIDADDASIASLNKQVALAKQVVTIQQYLMDQGAGTSLDLITAKNKEGDYDIRLQDTSGEAAKLRAQVEEIQAERHTFLDKWRSDHNKQLVQARQDLAEATESLNKAQRMKDFTELRAPVDSIVLEIADRSVGSVMREAETLVTLVPTGADLFVEADVSSRDVGYLRVGDEVRLKLEAYPFQKYGTLTGRLDTISPDSVPLKSDGQSQLVYHARIRLIEPPGELIRRGFRIRPGLVVSAEIKTGKRSIASYVLDPILRTADESLREP